MECRIAHKYIARCKGLSMENDDFAETPLIAFVNARSGGRAGAMIARVLQRAIGNTQVVR